MSRHSFQAAHLNNDSDHREDRSYEAGSKEDGSDDGGSQLEVQVPVEKPPKRSTGQSAYSAHSRKVWNVAAKTMLAVPPRPRKHKRSSQSKLQKGESDTKSRHLVQNLICVRKDDTYFAGILNAFTGPVKRKMNPARKMPVMFEHSRPQMKSCVISHCQRATPNEKDNGIKARIIPSTV
ncbi:hypothetical protein RvY_04849 [Ramazzottius varieornatus]|uniref:Uncharacterized protein n=1 Tax=Ramazzottius varieornatus TaxID=947166 RepID=A0A1D1UT09_RAMVA|nr:hypothetical protein RvY_04849 [Ramazzottius varieornatus]